MAGGITLTETDPSDIPTPPAGKATIFFDETASPDPTPAYKDSSDVTHSLKGSDGAVGPQGPMGPVIVPDEPVVEENYFSVANPSLEGGITQLTGDVTAGPGNGSQAATLADSGVTPDTYGDASNVPQLTVDSKGRITGVTNVPISASGGGAWTLVASNSPSAVNSVPFTGLSGYTDIRVVLIGITMTANSTAELQVSTNNGSSYLSSSGDYLGISGAGVATNLTRVAFYATDSTAARYGEILIEGFNISGGPKVCRANFFSADSQNLRIIPTTTALDALRVFTVSGTNFTGGTIYVFGRS